MPPYAEPQAQVISGELRSFEVTAYTLHPSETGGKLPGHPAYGITASGAPVEAGETVACSREMMGERVFIPYFNEDYECQDTGSAIGKNDIDVYFKSRERAFSFGRRELDVLVLEDY